jgi:hypothetical protein
VPTTPRPWIVLPHGPLERLDDALWAVESNVPGVPALRRRMSIVRRGDGTLLFFNAIPVDDPTLAEIRALGKPADLVLPQHLHMIDAHAFRAKLGVRVFAPGATRDVVARQVQVDGAFHDLPPDPGVAVGTVAGFKTGEGFMTVRCGPHVSLVVADVVLNVPRGPGILGLLFHLMGFSGDRPKLPVPVKLRVVRDRPALRRWLEQVASTPGLARIVPSHGPVVDRDPSGVLRSIASTV